MKTLEQLGKRHCWTKDGTRRTRCKMLKLSELKISPAPWRQEANGYGTLDVLGSDDSLVVAYENPINRNDQENRRLIAAAPELYEALRMYQEAFEEIRKSAWFLDANFHEIMCLNKVMTAADAALAKAAGESEVADER